MAQPKRKDSRKAAATDTASDPAHGSDAGDFPRWEAPRKLTRRGVLWLLAVLVLVNLPVLHLLLRGHPATTVILPFTDDFSSKARLAADYTTTGGFWRIIDNALFSPGVKNNPLWLKAALPENVLIEFEAKATSPEADIRVELYGDGENHMSGYELVLGGWGNTNSSLIKFDENARGFALMQSDARRIAQERKLGSADVVATGVYRADTGMRMDATGTRVEIGKTYHVRIERRGAELRVGWEGQPLLAFTDPFPLKGGGHDRFGLSSDEGDVTYDNLKITPLEAAGTFTASIAPPTPTLPPPGPFSDDFQRTALGEDWRATDAAHAKIEDGALVVEAVRNHPVWLRRPLPEKVAIEFDAWSDSPDGDIKVELFGDGQSFHVGDVHAAYDATGYVVIQGGWKNTLSVIARQEEHADNRVSRGDFRVVPQQKYHWRLTRTGSKILWSVDGEEKLTFEDAAPLTGPGHAFFGFSGWDARVHFDNLKVTAL